VNNDTGTGNCTVSRLDGRWMRRAGRGLSSVIAAVLVLGFAAPAAQAAPARAGASRATLRSVVEAQQFDLDGFGGKTDWYYHQEASGRFEFQPHFAYYMTNHFYWQQGPSSWESGQGTFYVVGDHMYERANGRWLAGTLPQSILRKYAREYNPNYGLNDFYSTPGVTRAGPGHYQTTCTIAQAKTFWVDYLSEQYSWLADYGFRTVTVSLWTNSSGWPLAITVSGRSSDVRLSYRLTLSGYNKPLVIKAPA
jgi:hypothetical protein